MVVFNGEMNGKQFRAHKTDLTKRISIFPGEQVFVTAATTTSQTFFHYWFITNRLKTNGGNCIGYIKNPVFF